MESLAQADQQPLVHWQREYPTAVTDSEICVRPDADTTFTPAADAVAIGPSCRIVFNPKQ